MVRLCQGDGFPGNFPSPAVIKQSALRETTIALRQVRERRDVAGFHVSGWRSTEGNRRKTVR